MQALFDSYIPAFYVDKIYENVNYIRDDQALGLVRLMTISQLFLMRSIAIIDRDIDG